MISSILVPVDGSEHSMKALELACDLTQKYAAKLHLLHVTQPPPGDRTLVLGASLVTLDSTPSELKDAGMEILSACEKIVDDYGCHIDSSDVESGDPVQRILECADKRGVDTIVMGNRGLSTLQGLLVGSVSNKVAHLAACTCITVR